MAKNTSRNPRYAALNVGGNEDTRCLIDASNRLADEMSRIFPSDPDIADRHYWLETIINHVPDYIYAKDTEGRPMAVTCCVVPRRAWTKPIVA